MLKQLFIGILLVISSSVFAQSGAEFGLISDNDLYTSSVNDKYYTNGTELFYRYLNKNGNANINKKMTEFKIGQYMYVPAKRFADDISVNDRPFAGYIFAEVGRNLFYQNESVLKMNVQLGFMGPNAFAEETQKLFHHYFGYKRIYGWQNQVHNAFAAQGNVLYSIKVLPKISVDNIDFHVNSEINFGTIFDGVSFGVLSRFSLKKLLPVYNSNLYGASANSDLKVIQNESEFYFYINPGITYQLYDATIQGSMFNENSPVTYALIPFRFTGEAGFKYRRHNWNLSYSFIYKGKEASNAMNTGYFYGSIVVGRLLN